MPEKIEHKMLYWVTFYRPGSFFAEDWSKYLNELPKPENIQGVEITINVIDANGNYRTIGTTTSDVNGYYSLAWTPDISGQYTLIATFAGTNAYYGASAQTAFFADELPAATPTQTTAPLSTSEQYFLPAVAAIIASIAIVGIVLALLLVRKRP